MASSTGAVSLEDGYRTFVSETASRIAKFKPLNAWINSSTQRGLRSAAHITAITFSKQDMPSKPRTIINESELKKELERGLDHELFIVENITPKVLTLLGGHYRVDPQFFLDYLDAVLPPRPNAKETDPLPWYRLGNIEEHLPVLRSVQSKMDHIHLRFIGSREYQPEDAKESPIKLPDRIEPDLSKSSVERIAGGYNPIPRDDKSFYPIAMTRHCAAAWFDGEGSQHGWRKGIILLDPPFEESKKTEKENVFGQRQNSKYRSFISRPMPPQTEPKDMDYRETYRSSFVHCLKWSPTVQVAGIPHPLVILQDLYRIIISEWIAVNTYFERDLNTIEWRLEADENVTLETFESFLGKLFILRRRIGKYKSLVDEQLELCRNQMPQAWGNSTTTTEASIAIQNDLEQVQQLISRNVNRISQSVDLITTIMSVREGKTSIDQNETLGFLTVVATVVLPFNAVAAILAIQTEYGPGQMKFWIFWVAAVAACLFIWLVFVLYRLAIYIRTQIRSRRVK